VHKIGLCFGPTDHFREVRKMVMTAVVVLPERDLPGAAGAEHNSFPRRHEGAKKIIRDINKGVFRMG
jgi:hypothetical protein